MKIRVLMAAVVLAAFNASPAMACVLAPGDQVGSRAQDLRAVTSVYEARIENVTSRDPYGDNVNFTVRPTGAIWGPVSPEPFQLSYEAGACTNWLFLMEADGPPRSGLKVIVMANPEGVADNRWLYIVRADADYIDSFMSDWHAARAGRPLSRQP